MHIVGGQDVDGDMVMERVVEPNNNMVQQRAEVDVGHGDLHHEDHEDVDHEDLDHVDLSYCARMLP